MSQKPRKKYLTFPSRLPGQDHSGQYPWNPEDIKQILPGRKSGEARLLFYDGSRIVVEESLTQVHEKLQAAGWQPAPLKGYSDEAPELGRDDLREQPPMRPAEVLALLLETGDLFVNYRPYVINAWRPEAEWELAEEQTLCLFVNGNDVLYWGVADAAAIPDQDALKKCYALYSADPTGYSGLKYVCWQKNMQPQEPWRELLQANGAWDELLAGLPLNDDETDPSDN